ncbi:MAG: GUN4 domain-containing protein, partial [Microcystaceae cyanobacterium]
MSIVKYSNGHFGFSVQKDIYLSLGGTSKYDEKIWRKFAQFVGWLRNENWLTYSE